MNPTNGAYPRGPEQPNGNFFNQRGAAPAPNQGAPPSRPLQTANAQVSRAERFEREKQRLIESCFSKIDERGQLRESYITHIRVEEDAMYQSSPPPPDTSKQHKKQRVIVVAVKNTALVQMHKARENDDGTFQIGKTWPFDELQAVQVYSPATARTPQEQQFARYAGDAGLTVIMTKPYYWRCNNVQEKDFFVGSLVRIYHRYAHRLPNLIGFTQQETQQLTASVAAIPPGARPQMGQNGPPRPQQQPQGMSNSPHSSMASSNMSMATQEMASTPPPLRTSQGRPHQAVSVPSERDSRSFQQTPSPTARFQPQPAQQVLQQQQQPPQQQFSQPQQQYTQPQPQPQPQPPPQMQFPSQQSRALHTATAPPQSTDTSFDGTNDRRPIEPLAVSQPFLPPLVTSQVLPPIASHVMSAVSPSSVSPGTQNLLSATTSRWRPEGVTPAPPRSFTESPGSEHSPGTTSPPPKLDAQAQIVPERRRPPLLDGPAAESQRSFRNTPDGFEPSPLGTQPPMQIPTREVDYSNTPLPEVRPLRTSGNYSSPQKPQAPAAAQQEPSRPLSPTPEVERAQSPDAASIHSNNSRDERQYRPGLGPMTKSSGDTAAKLRKAATAFNAFKPRAGGAGERLLGVKAAVTDEPDGVTRVVPAPLSRSATTQDALPTVKSLNGIDNNVRPLSLRIDKQSTPAPNGAISPASPTGPQQPVILSVPTVEVSNEQNTKRVSKLNAAKPRRQTDFFTKSLAAMQIDSSLMNGQHLEYEAVLSEFNWDTNLLQTKQIDVLKTNLRRDIARLEAGSWLGDSDHKDDRVAMVEQLLNQSIEECDQMEGLLTLYSVELSTLNEDVAYIEAQSQGLQVQTANQKLLHNELQSLIATISLDASQLEPLRRAPLGDSQGLEAIEESLLLLYRALQTIDPALLGGANAQGRKDEQALSSMRALQEKRSLYLQEAHEFLARIRKFAEPTFAMAFQKAKESLSRNSTSSRTSQVDLTAHDIARGSLWQLRPLMIFAEEIDRNAWEDIIATYVTQARGTYQIEIQEMIAQWKKGTRAPGSEEQDALFTAQEKEVDGLAGTARRLTVKRSQTLARMTRSAAVEKRAAISRNQENKQPHEAFAGALEETVPLIFTEQNFIVDFFHSKTLESTDFVEAVTASRPAERRGTNLLAPRRLIEGDRAMSQKLRGLMEGVFPTWQTELSGLLEWALADPFQGVGILCALERKRFELEDTNQEFIVRSINKIYERLAISFNQFVDGQIRAIDETKVKINKRKGVIAFIKVFPNFATIVESMLPPADGPERLETRSMVDEAYNKIIRLMFDSLKTIARATPAAAPASNADPEDKEALNHHILLIENMFHFYNELDEHGDPVLGEWRGKAMLMMSEHQELYLNAIIRRPLGKLLDFLDSVENLIGRGVAPASIPSSHPSHSRSVYKKILNSYDAKEIKRGIDTLRKRIDKHFGEADDAAISAELIKRITSECERKYNDVHERATRAAGEIYEGSVQVEFTKQDVGQAFRR